jgi:hypothetical protein
MSARPSRRLAALCALAMASGAWFALAPSARAQDGAQPPVEAVDSPAVVAPSEAEALQRAGREALQAGRVDEACPLLERSQQLEPTLPGLAFLAVCHERQGKTATAWREYIEVAETARRAGLPDREARARALAAQLQPSLHVVRIVEASAVAARTITLDGAPLPSPAPDGGIPVDPGDHRIVVEAPGHRAWRTAFVIGGDQREVLVSVPALEVIAPQTRSAATTTRPEAEPRVTPRAPLLVIAAVSGAVGAAGVVVGTVFGLDAFEEQERSDDLCREGCTDEGVQASDDARTSSYISTAAFGVGVAGLGAGTTLLVLGVRGSGPSTKRGDASASVLLGPGGVGVRGRW